MRIGGFEKQSFIDWEGKITAVIFTKGCNFRCRYCHNPELVYPNLFEQTEDLPEDEIFDYLSSRVNWLDGVVISGGEPTLQHDLKSFISRIKKMGYSVKLDTNGSAPELLEDLAKSNLTDCVAMDIKTIPDLEHYQHICATEDPELLKKIKKSAGVLKRSGIDYQFRTTIVPGFHTNTMLMKLREEYSCCKYKLQEYREVHVASHPS